MTGPLASKAPLAMAIARFLQISCVCPRLDLRQLRAVAGTQPKSQQISTVGPEHASVCIVRSLRADTPLPCHVMSRLERAVAPADAQFLRCTSHPNKQGSVEFVFGIPWSPSQFVHCVDAKTSEHEASGFRNMWFQKKWLRRALELRASEKRLQAGLDGDVASILRGKRLCLWKEMLHEYGYPWSDRSEDSMDVLL